MSIWDRLLGREPIQALKLQAYSEPGSMRVALPRVPWPVVSNDNLYAYSRKSEIVYACIEKKAQAATDPEVFVEQKNAQGEWEKIDDHPAAALVKCPNPYEDGETFLRAWIASENTTGVAYFEKVTSRAGQLVELYPLIPTMITEIYKRTARGDELDYYEYNNGSSVPIRFYPDELLIRRRHSRGSVFSGLSPLQVAIGTVDADIAATEYVRAFFNNDGTPSGILKITGRNLSDDQAQHLRQKWQANYSRHGKNRGGVAVMDDSADYQAIGAKLNELESESLTSIDESRICMAFGVPPILIGAYVGLVHVNQRASVREAQQDFWMNTMSPELKQMRHWLTWFVLPYFEDIDKIRAEQIRFNWDMKQVDALQEDIDAMAKRARENYKYGVMTLNEAREAINLEPVDGDQGDAFYQPTSPFDALPSDNTDTGGPPKQLMPPREAGVPGLYAQADPAALGELLLRANGNGSKKNFEYQGLTLSREPSALELLTDLKAIYDSYEQGRESLVKVIQTMRTDLITQAVKAIRRFDDADIHTLSLTPPPYAQKSISREIRKAIQEGRDQIAQDAARTGKSTLLIEKKSGLDDIIRAIVEVTISRIINEVATSAINIFTAKRTLGKTPAEIEDEIELELKDRSDAPYDLIARQAVNRAVNEGRTEEMRDRQDEIRTYEYSAILDKNVCDPCESWDGKQATDPEDLPQTPNEECEGGANCRCFIIAIFEGEAQ